MAVSLAAEKANTAKASTTVEEFWELSRKDDFWGELVEGEVREMVAPCDEHGSIEAKLIMRLGVHVEAYKLGRVYGECGYIVSRNPDTVREPDVSFIRTDRLPSQFSRRFSEILPDLAVEIVSPSDDYSETFRKCDMWLEAGVQEVWIVDPRRRAVTVLRNPRESITLRAGEALETSLLPGFQLPVADIFA